jgi:hypothetical protein
MPSHLPHFFLRQTEKVYSLEEHFPEAGLDESGDEASYSGFSASALSDEAQGLPLFDMEADMIDRFQDSGPQIKPCEKPLGQVKILPDVVNLYEMTIYLHGGSY